MKFLFAFLLSSSLALPTQNQARPVDPPVYIVTKNSCNQIKEACLAKGFVNGGYYEGRGVLTHCIRPIIQNVKQSNIAGLKNGTVLPVVPKETISNCKLSDPKFGTGLVGTQKPKKCSFFFNQRTLARKSMNAAYKALQVAKAGNDQAKIDAAKATYKKAKRNLYSVSSNFHRVLLKFDRAYFSAVEAEIAAAKALKVAKKGNDYAKIAAARVALKSAKKAALAAEKVAVKKCKASI
jgi:hypothetical protein